MLVEGATLVSVICISEYNILLGILTWFVIRKVGDKISWLSMNAQIDVMLIF